MDVQESRDFEGLRDYIFSGKRRPVDVPRPISKPRLDTKPGERVPSKEPIPASSQRPGKRSNDTIPYPRMIHSVPGIDLTDIFPGDLVFVHRTSNSTGMNHNRTNKIMSIRQINNELEKAQVGFSALGPGMQPQILAARKLYYEGSESRFNTVEAEFNYCQKSYNTGFTDDLRSSYVVLKKAKPIVEKLVTDAEAGVGTFCTDVDWHAVTMLRDWVPDGVMMSRDDDERNDDDMVPISRNQGVCVNVAVGGVTTVRNTNGKNAQQFDTMFMLRDSLFLILCAYQPDTALPLWRFKYHTTTGRVIDHIVRNVATIGINTRYPNEEGLAVSDLRSISAVWKVARLMDTKAVSHGFAGEHKVSVNVAIEQLDQFAFVSYMGYLYDSLDISPTYTRFPLDGSAPPSAAPPSAAPPSAAPPSAATPSSPTPPPSPTPPGGLGAPEDLTPIKELDDIVASATDLVREFKTVYEDAEKIVADPAVGAEWRAKAAEMKNIYQTAEVVLTLFKGIKEDMLVAENNNNGDEVERFLKEGRKNLRDMNNEKSKFDKLYDDIKVGIRGDLPPSARDPTVYEKPALPNGLKWPDNPLTKTFPASVSREVWDLLLGLLDVNLTPDPDVPGSNPSFDYEMNLVKFFKAWGKATPGLKYAMGFPWPGEGVLQKNEFERRNRVYATGFFGKIKDEVRMNTRIVDGEQVFDQKKTINRLAFVECLQKEGALGSVVVSDISSRPMGVFDSLLRKFVKPMR